MGPYNLTKFQIDTILLTSSKISSGTATRTRPDTRLKIGHEWLICNNYMHIKLKQIRKRLLIKGLDSCAGNKKYLLIDSPSYVFDQFYYHYLNSVYTVLGSTGRYSIESSRLLIDQGQFVSDALNALLGLQSASFTYNKTQVNIYIHRTWIQNLIKYTWWSQTENWISKNFVCRINLLRDIYNECRKSESERFLFRGLEAKSGLIARDNNSKKYFWLISRNVM